MKILFLTHFYPPEMGGASARLHGLARRFAQRNHAVTVITGFPNYPSGRILEEYRGKRYYRETIDGVQVIRTWIYASPRKGGLQRLANYFSFVLSSVVTGLRVREKFDVIVASSPPLFIGLSGIVLARWWKRPLLFDLRDLWPELAVEAGEFSTDAAIVRWGKRLERFLYARVDHITVVTEGKSHKLRAKGVPGEKISIVANGVDLDRLTNPALCTRAWRQELTLEGKFVALYAGLIGIFQGVEIIAQAAHLLRGDADIHFVIVGDGVRRTEIERYVRNHQLPNVTLLPPQPSAQIPGLYRASDLSLVPLVNEDIVDAVPSKLLESWGCLCPVVLIAGGEARRLVEEAGGGIVVKPGCPDQLVDAVTTMKSASVETRRHFAENGYAYVQAHFDRAILAQQLECVLQEMVNGP